MNKETGLHLRYVFFTLFILLQVFFILFGDYNYGLGGFENIRHFQIARFSVDQPAVYFNNYGNPLFTLFLSPFAHFGFKVARSLNLIISVLILLVTLKIADRVNGKNQLIVIVLAGFAPVYFFLSTSCLPALLFSLLLMVAVYFFTEEKYGFSAFTASFLPAVYPGGGWLLPVFAGIFLLNKNFRPLFLLLAGSLIFSIAGYFSTGNVGWLFASPAGVPDTPRGESLSFIFGAPLLLFVIFGLAVWILDLRKKFSISNGNFIMFFLLAGSFLLIALPVLFPGARYQPEYISVALVPLAALIGGRAAGFLFLKMKNKSLVNAVLAVFAFTQAALLFSENQFALSLDSKDELIKKAAIYLRFNEPNAKIFFFNPLLPWFLETDPADTSKLVLISEKTNITEKMGQEDVLVWDTEFGKNKTGIVLNELENDSMLFAEEAFYLHDKTVPVSETDACVRIFKKTEKGKSTRGVSDYYTRTLSFEDYLDPRVKEIGGIKMWELDSTQEYSPNLVLTPDLFEQKEMLDFSISVGYKAEQPLVKGQALLVLSIINEGKNIYYNSGYIISQGNIRDEFQIKTTIHADIPLASKILIYVWNKGRKHLFIENLKVEVKSY